MSRWWLAQQQQSGIDLQFRLAYKAVHQTRPFFIMKAFMMNRFIGLEPA
jgi:hypothetical protein